MAGRKVRRWAPSTIASAPWRSAAAISALTRVPVIADDQTAWMILSIARLRGAVGRDVAHAAARSRSSESRYGDRYLAAIFATGVHSGSAENCEL